MKIFNFIATLILMTSISLEKNQSYSSDGDIRDMNTCDCDIRYPSQKQHRNADTWLLQHHPSATRCHELKAP